MCIIEPAFEVAIIGGCATNTHKWWSVSVPLAWPLVDAFVYAFVYFKYIEHNFCHLA